MSCSISSTCLLRLPSLRLLSCLKPLIARLSRSAGLAFGSPSLLRGLRRLVRLALLVVCRPFHLVALLRWCPHLSARSSFVIPRCLVGSLFGSQRTSLGPVLGRVPHRCRPGRRRRSLSRSISRCLAVPPLRCLLLALRWHCVLRSLVLGTLVFFRSRQPIFDFCVAGFARVNLFQ